MKASEIKVGMKVRPTKKTKWTTLEKSEEWRRATALGHDWLYVSGYEKTEDCWILSHKRFAKLTDGDPDGDFFNASDFKKYAKEK